MKKWWVYILKLEQGKYYVGITSQTPEIRMQEHSKHIRAANWTKEYKPVEIIFKQDLGVINKSDAESIENRVVRNYMATYGLNNVRGGDLTKVEDYSRFKGYLYLKNELDLVKMIVLLYIVIVILVIIVIIK